MTLPLTLWTKDAFIVESGQELILHWLLFGGFIALLIYHLFLLVTLKETTYLYFVIMLAGMLAVLLEYTGYMGVYIFPSLYNYKLFIFHCLLSLMYVSIILFSDTFLELKTRLAKTPLDEYRPVGRLGSAGTCWYRSSAILILARLMTPMQLVTIAATLVIGIIAWRKDFQTSPLSS